MSNADDSSPKSAEQRGRPRLYSDDEILDLALQAFASQGYDSVSVRSLNASLGLSHGTISQRFGTKERLYYAAVDHGFTEFVADVEREATVALSEVRNPQALDQLRATILGFLRSARRRPELGRLMNQEGQEPTERLAHIVDSVLVPMMTTTGTLLNSLRDEGVIRPITSRGLFFLVTHGAEAPFTLTALSDVFDAIDGPLDPEAHSLMMADVLIAGLRLP